MKLSKGNKIINIGNIHADIFDSLSTWQTRATQYWNVLSQFHEEAKDIENLLRRTLTVGESNSALIIGPRGCGKSAYRWLDMVEECVDDRGVNLEEAYQLVEKIEWKRCIRGRMLQAILNILEEEGLLTMGITIKLTGLLQTDDRLALKEIIRQFGLNTDGEVYKNGSFAENLSAILKTLQSGRRETTMPVIFILDEFDLFCHHRNQTLLYNLFDICQSAQVPVCVLGLTCRLDVIELLEKRVKSRFSHRQIYLFSHESFNNYSDVAQSLLKVDHSKYHEKDIGVAWNTSVEYIFKEQEVITILKKRFCFDRHIRSLKAFLLLVVSRLNEEEPWLKVDHFRETSCVLAEDSKINVIRGLSILQLTLVISMKHLAAIYEGQPFNFEMVYHQYSKFGEKYSSVSLFERPVVFKAFNQLQCLELIRPIEQNRTCVQREYRLMQLMVLPKQIEEAIMSMSNVPTFLTQWSASEV